MHPIRSLATTALLLWVLGLAAPAGAQDLGPPSSARSSPAGWTLLNPPPARSQHTAVWDPLRGRMLVFGGSGTARLNDLWAYDPGADSWTQIPPAATPPPPRVGHTAIWDPTNQQVLVYGGYGGGGSSQLWSYQPATNVWTELVAEGPAPPARGFHSAAWDQERSQMLVFAGIGPSFDPLSDLWAYRPSSNSWVRLSTPSPRPFPVFYHSAVWDPLHSQMLVFGGADPTTSEFLNELWAYRPADNVWVPLAPFVDRVKSKVLGLPRERLSHTATWDPTGGQMLVFGGGCGAGCYRDDLWAYQPAADKWFPVHAAAGGPTARGGHSAVWDPAASRVLVFGGAISDGSSLRELWSYRPSGQTWARLAPLQPTPPARQQHTAVWDPAGRQMLVFGGYVEGGQFLDELLSYRPTSNAWTALATVGAAPPARSNHAAAWDGAAGQMLVFGGYSPAGYLADLWSYDARASRWQPLPQVGSPDVGEEETGLPPAREEHSLVWDDTDGQLLLFGGSRGGNEPLDDLWAYDPTSGAWTALAPDGERPVGRFRHSAVWDAARGEMLVFGGYGGGFPGGYLDDVWSYRPTTNTWARLGSGGLDAPDEDEDEDEDESLAVVRAGSFEERPGPRSRHTAVWDADGDRMLVFGGFAGGIDYLNDLWSYEPATDSWANLTPSLGEPAPTARAWHSAAWDSAGDRLLIFGGHGSGSSDEIWSYHDERAGHAGAR